MIRTLERSLEAAEIIKQQRNSNPQMILTPDMQDKVNLATEIHRLRYILKLHQRAERTM